MELNRLNFIASQQAALNKQVTKEETKPESKEDEVRDNKPAAQQVSGEDVLSFMATRSVDVKINTAKASKEKGTEDRVAGYMSDFEAAFEEASSLGLSEDAIFAILDKMA